MIWEIFIFLGDFFTYPRFIISLYFVNSSSALKANKEPSLYDNFANDFNQLKEKVNDVVSRPDVKDNMFYILMGIIKISQSPLAFYSLYFQV